MGTTRNTFVQVLKTLEIGKWVEFDNDPNSAELVTVRFWDEPEKFFERKYPSHELRKFVPQNKGTVWVPRASNREDGGSPIRRFDRGSFRVERADGRWGIRVAASGKPPEDHFLACDEVIIFRSGRTIDPVACLGARVVMSTKFFVTRRRILSQLYDQIQVARGYRSILASAVRPFMHQINTLIRVLSDPIPRFILADEVGLGKTIEAGLIIRQVLTDNQNARALVIVPRYLMGQWRSELENKLLLDRQFVQERIKIVSFDDATKLNKFDVIVVDESHRITSEENQSLYSALANEVRSDACLLLLTATPMRGNRLDFLKLLHLIDPQAYSLNEVDKFDKQLAQREMMARDVELLKIKGLPRGAIKDCLGRLLAVLPIDAHFLKEKMLIEEAPSDSDESDERRVRLSAYLRETYRISRRVIRNRRDEVKQQGFIVAGRELKNGSGNEITESLRPSIDAFLSTVLRELNTKVRNNEISVRTAFEIVDPLLEAGLSAPEVFDDELNSSQFSKFKIILGEDISADARNLSESIRASGTSNRWIEVLRICADHVTYPHSGGVVVFVRSTDVAKRLGEDLVAKHGRHQVRMHLTSMTLDDQDDAVRYFLQESGCRILIMDRSGEEGRNLQEASEIVHFSIPFSSNQLEQRLGRADRFSEDTHHRACSTVFVERSSPLIYGQFEYLSKGLNIFERSVATAQRFLVLEYETLLSHLLERGLDAFVEDCDELASRLDNEIEEIASIDFIESVSTAEEFTISDFQKLLELDENSELGDAVEGLFIDDRIRKEATASIGLFAAPTKYPRQDLTQSLRLAVETSNRSAEFRGMTLARKDELTRFVARDSEYVFSRPVARALRGSVLYRVGEPFVDWTIDWLSNEEIGRTWAVWRVSKGFKVPTTIFSGVVQVGNTENFAPEFSDWAQSTFRRRMELALPSRMMYMGCAGDKTFNHRDTANGGIPEAQLKDINLTDEHWRILNIALPDLKTSTNIAAERMTSSAQKMIRDSMEYRSRFDQAERTHNHAIGVLRTQSERTGGVSPKISSKKIAEENEIHKLVMESLESIPCRVFAMGLIVYSS